MSSNGMTKRIMFFGKSVMKKEVKISESGARNDSKIYFFQFPSKR